MLPAVIGGFDAMAITVLVAVPAALLTRSPRRAAVVLTALAVGSLPWFIPSLLHAVYVDPASVAAFAARADTPFGSLGSLVMLGGAWNAQTVPKAYGGAWSILWLAVVIVALAGYVLVARPQRRWPGLGLAAVAGLVLAALGVTAAGRDLLRSMISAWPGFAVLRDAQQFVAPLALAEAVGFGLAVAAVLNPVPAVPKTELPVRADTPATAPAVPKTELPVRADTPATAPAVSEPVRPPRAAATVLGVSKPMLSVHADAPTTTFGVSEPMRPPRADAPATVLGVPESERPARVAAAGTVLAVPESERPARVAAAGTVLAVLALLAPVLLLPGLAWGAAGRLRPAAYPAAWLTAARALDANPAGGSVLLLPWATYRTPPWNHGEVVLDPWTRLLSRPLIWNDGTQVGDVALAPDDPRARELASAIRGSGPLTATLRAAGVRFVLDDADGPQPQLGPRLPGSVMIIDQPGLTVYQLPG